jgi:hypothetical protein
MHSTWSRRSLINLLILAPALGAAAQPVPAACTAAEPRLRVGARVTFHAAVPEAAALLDAAIAHWSTACHDGYGWSLPTLERTATAAEATYRVEVHRSNPHGPQCGTFRGRRLAVYRFARGERGERLHCGDPILVLAHEIGHALGLDDVDPTLCPHAIMADIHRANRTTRRVDPADCRAVALAWTTPRELGPALPPVSTSETEEVLARAFATPADAGLAEGAGRGLR